MDLTPQEDGENYEFGSSKSPKKIFGKKMGGQI